MSMKNTLLLAAALVIVSTQVSFAQTDEEKAAAAGAKRIEAAQLKELYLGHIIVGKTPKGYSYRTPIKSDGSIAANKKRGPGMLLISDKNEACMKFAELWDGKPMCWRVYEVSKGRYQTFKTTGALSANVTFEPLK